MSDPYANLSNTFNDMTRNLLMLKGQNMNNAIQEAQMGMQAEQHNIDNSFKERGMQLQERQINQANNTVKPHQANFGSIEAKKTTNILTTFGVKKDNPFIAEIEGIGKDNSINKAGAYQYFKSAYPQYRESLVENMAEDFVKKSEKNPGWENTPEAQKQKAFIDALEADETGDSILAPAFADTIKSLKDEEANTRAALAAATSEERAALANPETQFIINKTKQYAAKGMAPEDAAVKAYEELSAIRSKQARDGKNNITINAPGNSQVESLAAGILDGTIDPNAISKRGGLQAAVWGRVKQLDPSFNIIKAGAGAKFEGSTATMQTKALLNTINPLLDKLDTAGAILGNSSIPALNKAKNYLKEQTGDADIVGFNNLRDAVIAEVERGLMGTGVLSDSKYLRELNNMRSSHSYPQLQAAIKNTKMVIQARLEALAEGPNAPIAGQEAPKRRSTDPKKIGRFTVEVD